MVSIRPVLVLFLACATACSAEAERPLTSSQATAILTDACPLYVRGVNSDGTLSPYPFIRPEHVASMLRAKPLYEGENALWVTLTPVGAKRMHDQTAKSISVKMAVFCGDTELNRPLIVGPVSTSFRVFISDASGT